MLWPSDCPPWARPGASIPATRARPRTDPMIDPTLRQFLRFMARPPQLWASGYVRAASSGGDRGQLGPSSPLASDRRIECLPSELAGPPCLMDLPHSCCHDNLSVTYLESRAPGRISTRRVSADVFRAGMREITSSSVLLVADSKSEPAPSHLDRTAEGATR